MAQLKSSSGTGSTTYLRLVPVLDGLVTLPFHLDAVSLAALQRLQACVQAVARSVSGSCNGSWLWLRVATRHSWTCPLRQLSLA
jgi:hypothetical protein